MNTTDTSRLSGASTHIHDVIIVGAGFAGLYGVYRLRKDGWDVRCIEAASDVGGVWNHNRYPGARCDVLSVDYSYSFSEDLQQDWVWSERYAGQPEILRYMQHVADRFDLRRDIIFNTRVDSAERNDKTGLWTVETSTGRSYTARFIILATGPLSVPADPRIAGLSDFAGELYRTAQWPHEPVSFAGKRVGVIGTGSSGVQCIPEIAKTAAHITVFQRTPVYAFPARNRALRADETSAIKSRYADYRREMRAGKAGNYMFSAGKTATEFSPEDQRKILDEAWASGGIGVSSVFIDSSTNLATNTMIADYVRDRIRERVKDPIVAEKLCPKTYPIGSKRPCLDSGFYEVFNQPNATLVDLSETPIETITPSGLQTTTEHHDLDTLVLATGFDALTGAVLAIDPVNGQGQRMSQAWRDGPMAYLGYSVAGFPNLFMVGAAGSVSVFANLVVVAEESIDWIADALAWMKAKNVDTIQSTPEAQAEWMETLSAIAARTFYAKTASWYTGANIPGKKRGITIFLGGLSVYLAKCREVAAAGYKGFKIEPIGSER